MHRNYDKYCHKIRNAPFPPLSSPTKEKGWVGERKSTAGDLSLGRWPATIACFSDCTAYSAPSLALRRAGLPSCVSQQKSDGHQLPCGGPLPEHGTTTLNYFASKQTTGYAAFGSRRRITLSYNSIFPRPASQRFSYIPSSFSSFSTCFL